MTPYQFSSWKRREAKRIKEAAERPIVNYGKYLAFIPKTSLMEIAIELKEAEKRLLQEYYEVASRNE